MTNTYRLSGMTCGNCEKKVKDILMQIKSVNDVTVSKEEESVVIEMSRDIPLTEFRESLSQFGNKYTINILEHEDFRKEEKSWFSTYKPVLLIFIYILSISGAIEFLSPEILIERWMRHFMAGFFLTFSFFILIAYEIVLHIYNHNEVDFQTVMSVLCGYLVLGVIGFFIFSIIHLAEPGAFNTSASNFDDMIYYTYITLTTIGYGDITPQTPSAKSAALILGIAGQFYTTVIIALIVGKFLQHKSVR